MIGLEYFWKTDVTALTLLGYNISPIELLGTLTGLLSVWYGTKNNSLVWYFGIVNVLAFGIVFFQIQLYADMLLQGFYFFATIYGWWLWSKKSATDISAVAFLNTKERYFYSVVFFMLFLIFWGFTKLLPLITESTQASFAHTDSLLSAASVIATILMAKRKIETWILWIVIDFLSIYLYLQKEVLFIAIEYGLFGLLAIQGLVIWNKLRTENYKTST